MNMPQPVPVIFAADDNYAMPLGVAIESLLASKKPETLYHLHCMIPQPLNPEHQRRMDEFSKRYSGFSLHWLDMRQTFADAPVTIPHTSFTTYYRLLIPSLFPQYERCIYLDADVLVRADLSSLYAAAMNCSDGSEAWIAALPHAILQRMTKINGYRIPRGSYINAGVMVMNLKALRHHQVENQFRALIPQPFRMQDQDIINIVCQGHIAPIDLSYNFLTKFMRIRHRLSCLLFYRRMGMDFLEAMKHPRVIHYADQLKPWNNQGYCREPWEKFRQQSPYASYGIAKK